jgi:hypothetical protein
LAQSGKYRVILRMCLVDHHGLNALVDRPDQFPELIDITLNGKNSRTSEVPVKGPKKVPDIPKNLSADCKQGENTMHVKTLSKLVCLRTA